MTIETKYGVNDVVWIISPNGNLKEMIIAKTSIEVYGNRYNPSMDGKISISHDLKDYDKDSNFYSTDVSEDKIYDTKQKAGEAWMKLQGLKCGMRDD